MLKVPIKLRGRAPPSLNNSVVSKQNKNLKSQVSSWEGRTQRQVLTQWINPSRLCLLMATWCQAPKKPRTSRPRYPGSSQHFSPCPSPNTSPFQGLGFASLPSAPDSYRRQPFLVLGALFARTPTPAPSHVMAQSVLQAMSSLDPSRRFWLFSPSYLR